ncbi:MAG: hypothetical protein Q8K67_05645 [Geothrix sp.]|nr:hypothetical protein [Geothrix sp.]
MELKSLPRPEHPNPYTVLGRRFVYDSPWIRVREERFFPRPQAHPLRGRARWEALDTP